MEFWKISFSADIFKKIVKLHTQTPEKPEHVKSNGEIFTITPRNA